MAKILNNQALEVQRYSTYRHRTPGQRKGYTQIDWAMPLANGSSLIDLENRTLLQELKTFMEAATSGECPEVRMNEGSINTACIGMHSLADYMVTQNLSSISQVTELHSWNYMEFIEYRVDMKLPGSAGRPRALTYSSAWNALHILNQLFSLRHAMRARGTAALEYPPYAGRRTEDVVKHELGLTRKGKIQPVPEDVAAAALVEAYKYVEHRSSDIIELQQKVLACFDGGSRSPYMKAGELIRNYQFCNDPGESSPWRQAVTPYTRTLIDGRTVRVKEIQALRRMVVDLTVACTIVLQAGTGMRSHEVLSLTVGREKKELPECISTALSTDQLMELFLVRGVTAKGDFENVTWLCGTRPTGTKLLPVTVRAIQVLEWILSPWRNLGETNQLLVTFSASRGLPRVKESVGRMTSVVLSEMQKVFIVETLERLGHHRNSALVNQAMHHRAHQWRVSFAQFVFRTNPMLTTALRDHYKHINEIYTDTGYIGNVASQLEDLEGERVQATVQTLLGMSMGRMIGAGTVAKQAKVYAEHLKRELKAAKGATPEQKAMSMVLDHDVRIWNGTYASCFIRVSRGNSKCNEIAGLPRSLHTSPNFATRSPELCAGCECAWILPEHRDEWVRRRDDNQKIIDQAMLSGTEEDGATEIARRRVRQAIAILKRLDRATP